MIKVKMFSDYYSLDVAGDVASFLNIKKGIQILDISWFVKGKITFCAITYFET